MHQAGKSYKKKKKRNLHSSIKYRKLTTDFKQTRLTFAAFLHYTEHMSCIGKARGGK